ncbi:MAG: NAD(+)/NADH kinase [Clostridiales bacterium]|nr:NAD(+)/NADH kinase [Clostridiales bacterium]
MKRFMLVVNAYKDEGLALSNRIAAYIRERGGSAGVRKSNVEGIEGQDFPLSDIPAGTECIIVLGGDGTLIRTATRLESLEIPLVGVNLGTLGYLCELEESTAFAAVDRLMEDSYFLEERSMLYAEKLGEGSGRLALNDVTIHRTGDLMMLRLPVYVNGEYLATYHADGIVIATPTGSTGYSMSAGGPIVDPKARMLLLTPINAHDAYAQSIVLGDEDEIEIELGTRRSQRDERASVSFDGDTAIRLAVGDRVKISRAKNIVKICRLGNQSFLEILRKKMQK